MLILFTIHLHSTGCGGSVSHQKEIEDCLSITTNEVCEYNLFLGSASILMGKPYFAYKHFTIVLHNQEEHPHGDVGILARDAACGILHNMADAVNAPLEGAERSNIILRGRGRPRPRVDAR